ncbi:TIGR03560 family F420-dependent LLM class oxidoreductase [Actinoplanes sp. GCM10030250]|uniref:TIGR03560 family F420-dependent LLM class oxidoreductase n=1 Tax=Actinoplanes sp. GCM10030250 TaxID=3273376 RepID=UPI0036244B50
MKIGLHISNFTWPDGAPRIGSTLAGIAAAADDAGFERISVMDHVWQIGVHGPPELEMLEAYTTLGFLAAHTHRAKLLTLVTGVTYRDPGLLAKAVTTLDVLSGGRAILGIGAAWNAEESAGLGLRFPPTAERFERLEETLRICRQMFDGDETAFAGKHYRLDRLLNSPLPLSRPGPPILIGGGGEKKTLLLVAKYADACNLFPTPELQHKLDVLKRHCDTVGRDYAEIEKTVLYRFTDDVSEMVEEARRFAAMGISVLHGGVREPWESRRFEIFRDELVPALEAL